MRGIVFCDLYFSNILNTFLEILSYKKYKNVGFFSLYTFGKFMILNHHFVCDNFLYLLKIIDFKT